ncbi:unnamed protein product [Zymoseptoria tritici ST99CH_1A5]|uniref:Uncharacterized protein n=2 Tax=Zymoseptoria tritici TaxID=1047171 RepID=A0A2H1H338_ZYMTR|nr:unnamed protein product [Zymoseptoria tritici ST99CH_1E4]SMR63351.1 unnamed protein product [Zymoseptoria tritici ST99CH_3D1]SMY28694.1 unnamed protein product [Zymoseptoria tritici ST99CH_1A5]
MADIQQWRRKIQPARSRTPAPTPTTDFEEPDDVLSPTTPKLRLKPKLSSYFNPPSKPAPSIDDLTGPQLPKWPSDQLYPDPKPEDEMDAVMCHLMSNPFVHLDVHFNGSLMRIFEGYNKLKEEKFSVQQQLDARTATCKAVASKFNMAEKDWEDEKQDYKDEVKRLEVLLAKASKRGLAEVTLARQDSKLRHRNAGGLERKETIFEFLEKTQRIQDQTFSNQRATMKPLIQSPSDQDRKVSIKLTQKKSMTNIHDDLPFGTPPLDMRFSLGEASMLEKQAARQSGRRRPRTDSSTTEESFSASSCADESLPDDDPTITDNRINSNSARGNEAAIENFASTLARRRIVEPPRTTTPQLLDLFPSPPVQHVDRTTSVPNALGINLSASHSAASSKTVPQHPIVKRSTVMTRASGFLQKLRPQLSVDMSPVLQRRFSFEPGDDFAAQLIPSENLSPHITKTLRTISVPHPNSSLQLQRFSTTKTRAGGLVVKSPHSDPALGRKRETQHFPCELGLQFSIREPYTFELRSSPSSLAVAAARAANAGETVSLAGSIGGERRSSAKSSHSAMSMQSDGGDLRRENSRPC